MNKKIVSLVVAIVLMFSFASCAKQTPQALQKVQLNEVVHSIFYAPQYVAMEKGFFKDEGLEITLDVGQGADKSMAALLSGGADIALMGTEAAVYVYNEGKEDYAVPFAQLTQTAGNFLVAREKIDNFDWQMVKGKTIIGGRAGGMPQMVLEYICKQNNIDPTKDVEILTNLQFATTAGAFAGDVGDFTAEFDPSAFHIEKEGKGYVVASMGKASGEMPYTVYMATKSYVEANPETMQKFTNAVYKGQQWVLNNSAQDIAKVIAPYFKDSDISDLTFMVERYKAQGSWATDPLLKEEGFNLIKKIMNLEKDINYKTFINTEFANKIKK